MRKNELKHTIKGKKTLFNNFKRIKIISIEKYVTNKHKRE